MCGFGNPKTPSIQIVLTSGLEVSKEYLLWAHGSQGMLVYGRAGRTEYARPGPGVVRGILAITIPEALSTSTKIT